MIAHAIGEPFGTLLLTLAVTIIEVALIATIMLGDTAAPALARDTVFAVVMIVCNGLVGICIVIGGLRYREQDVQVLGANVYLGVLFVLATITLVMPDYTRTTAGPVYSAAPLGFVPAVAAAAYALTSGWCWGSPPRELGAAVPDIRLEHADVRRGQDQRPVRAGPHGRVRRIPVHAVHTVTRRRE